MPFERCWRHRGHGCVAVAVFYRSDFSEYQGSDPVHEISAATASLRHGVILQACEVLLPWRRHSSSRFGTIKGVKVSAEVAC